MTHHVQLISRSTCGSCQRVARQIAPIVAEYGAELEIVELDLNDTPDLAAEFGDRVPVVLVDDEEIACWEIDDEDLIAALS
ncbi:MAG TPA: thioredoxin family protein [Candidatus Corynebacterium gallistercoris]|uniref:Thioredoxin family protein n=1 Tax=Candidatus Corynebacterium gallistercoris TaxID=2838530 RepID=A0A9D1RXC3_9CORY|nr:thioredoxin family protein [Candidatus Corynebacterium gallistercoris]